MFRKKWVKSSAKKFDKLITTIIVWGAIASIFWASRTKKWKKITEKIKTSTKKIFSRWFSFMWKSVVSITNFLSKK